MTEYATKAELLTRMSDGYTEFTALLSSLNAEQLTTSGVNGKWSIKDTIAHLSAWQNRILTILEVIYNQVEFSDPTPGMSEDDINELYYQASKDRPLIEVRNEFAAISLEVQSAVERLSDAQLNTPVPWWSAETPIWLGVAGDTFQHYQEHTKIIQQWLASQQA